MSDAASPPPLTPAEVDEVAVAVALELFDPGPAALVATQLARAMKAATTREAQDRAGAKILHTFAAVAE